MLLSVSVCSFARKFVANHSETSPKELLRYNVYGSLSRDPNLKPPSQATFLTFELQFDLEVKQFFPWSWRPHSRSCDRKYGGSCRGLHEFYSRGDSGKHIKAKVIIESFEIHA